jgi:hypothetical protein
MLGATNRSLRAWCSAAGRWRGPSCSCLCAASCPRPRTLGNPSSAAAAGHGILGAGLSEGARKPHSARRHRQAQCHAALAGSPRAHWHTPGRPGAFSHDSRDLSCRVQAGAQAPSIPAMAMARCGPAGVAPLRNAGSPRAAYLQASSGRRQAFRGRITRRCRPGRRMNAMARMRSAQTCTKPWTTTHGRVSHHTYAMSGDSRAGDRMRTRPQAAVRCNHHQPPARRRPPGTLPSPHTRSATSTT